jgi:hypothetical protein
MKWLNLAIAFVFVFKAGLLVQAGESFFLELAIAAVNALCFLFTNQQDRAA